MSLQLNVEYLALLGMYYLIFDSLLLYSIVKKALNVKFA